MSPSAHRCLVLISLLLAPATLACSDQAEGERCDYDRSGNNASNQGRDCESGLECVPASQLLAHDGADRCCPPEDEPFSDDRCRRDVRGSSTGGTGGTAGGAGMSPAAGSSGTAGGAGMSQAAGSGGTAGGAGVSQAGTGASAGSGNVAGSAPGGAGSLAGGGAGG